MFGKRSPVVVTAFLPFSTTVTGNCINRAVTPRHTGRIRWTRSSTLAWRNRRNTALRAEQWPHGMTWSRRHRRRQWHRDLFIARNLVEQLLARASPSATA
ncbi:MAG: hypothetical protein E5299_00115 [Burkholderia gladioli]|nr:MAG: hypothetical protein E5299_00115 [Burkholderia gladioli]